MIAVFVLLLLMILDTVMIVLGIICCEYISVMFYSESMIVAVWGLCREIRIYIKIKQLFDVRCRCAFASLMSAPLKCEDFAGERSGEKPNIYTGRVLHLARWHTKARVRKKNMKRIMKGK